MDNSYKQNANTRFWTGKTIAGTALTAGAGLPFMYGYKKSRMNPDNGKVKSFAKGALTTTAAGAAFEGTQIAAKMAGRSGLGAAAAVAGVGIGGLMMAKRYWNKQKAKYAS